jgi:NADH:ubiquinone reductase (H+-translocating)
MPDGDRQFRHFGFLGKKAGVRAVEAMIAMENEQMATSGLKKVLIVGGGFGGLHVALHLEKAMKRGAPIEVTLVNRDNFFLFTPMLHEVAASDLDITHIVNPVRKLLKRVAFFDGDVLQVDLEARKVRVSHGFDPHTHDLPYDHLVLALGCTTNFYGLPGLQDCALTMKSLGDAIHLRNHLIGLLEEADTECAAGSRKRLLTFVVAGGGFAGVETMAAVNDFVRESIRFYPRLKESDVRMVLVHAGPVILPELSESLGTYAQRKLADRGVEIRLNAKVSGVTATGTVTLTDGASIETDTIVWTAGTTPHPLLHGLPCAGQNGKIPVDPTLEAPRWPGVWALGDCAVISDPRRGKPYPPTAQHALREGRTVAQNILASIQGTAKRPFAFRTMGQLAAIGRRTGVADIMGFKFSGFVAWWMWRTIYWSKLPRFEKKLRVALDWTLDLFFSKDLVKLATWRGSAETLKRGNR